MLHITEPDDPRDLYRIFYYDCLPTERTIIHPLTKTAIDCSSMAGTRWANDFYANFSHNRKVAIRMGELAESTATYVLKDKALQNLLTSTRSVTDLKEDDFRIDVKQFAVPPHTGLDCHMEKLCKKSLTSTKYSSKMNA